MTGRSLHDALLRVLRDRTLRDQLLGHTDATLSLAREPEWQILRRCSQADLSKMARFLARHYYMERVVRLFRHIRRLVPQTGRDPCLVLDMASGQTVLDHAVVGSPQTAEAFLRLIERYLLEDEAALRSQFPYWQDLVQYHGAMFRLEAQGGEPGSPELPCRSGSAEMREFEWDLPAVIAALRVSDYARAKTFNTSSILLITASSNQQVTTLRCSAQVRSLFDSADGRHTMEELGAKAGLSRQDTEQTLRRLKSMGAIRWKEV